MEINKQVLREAAEKAGKDKWQSKKIGGDFCVIRSGSHKKQNGITSYQPIAEIDHKPVRDFVAAANPATVLALLDELEAAERRIAELEARTVTLPPLNDDLVAILGRPNFTCAHLAELLRKSGEDIRRKSEFEQAAVIHWFLELYLEHGDKWEGVAKADIQSRAAAAGIGKGE